MNDMLEIGKLVNTHGIRGEVKIQPWCDDPYVFDELEYLIIDGKEYDIERNRYHKTCQIVKLAGVDDMNAAELLKNKIVYINREDIPLPEGRYFVADILGLEVRSEGRAARGSFVSEAVFFRAMLSYEFSDAKLIHIRFRRKQIRRISCPNF